MPRIFTSIVIVNFNARAALLTLLKSLRLQESTGGEVIVVDCASFDESVEAAQHFPTVKIVRLETNRGFFAAANKGIDQATGDVVVVAHADIITDIHSLADLADEAREGEGKKVVAVLPQLIGVDDSPQPFVGKLPTMVSGWKTTVPTLDHLTEGEWARFVCVAFNREHLNAVGLFDQNFFLYCGDTDLCARIHEKKMRVLVSNNIRVKHAGAVIGKQTPSHLKRILHKDRQRYAQKHFPTWQTGIVKAMGSVRQLLDRSK